MTQRKKTVSKHEKCIRESQVEAYLIEQVEKHYGLTRKVKWIGRRRAPDRLVALPQWVGFVEVKRPGEKPTAEQVAEHNNLRAHGVNVLVIDSYEAVNRLISKFAVRW